MATMTVGKRLGLGFGAVIALMIIVALIGITNMRSIQAQLDDIVNDEFPKTVQANNMVDGINAIGIFMRDSLLVTGQEDIQKELAGIEEKRKVIDDSLEKLQASITSEKGKTMLAKVLDARTKYADSQDAFIKLQKEGKQAEAKTLLLGEAMGLQDAYIKVVNELTTLQSDRMTEIGGEANQQVKNALIQIIIITLIALLAAAFMGYLITRNLMKQLGGEPDYAADAVGKIAAGDLTMHLRSGQATTAACCIH